MGTEKVGKRVGKLLSHALDESSFVLDTIRLPLVRKRQEELLSGFRKASNYVRAAADLPLKKYRVVTKKGIVVVEDKFP